MLNLAVEIDTLCTQAGFYFRALLRSFFSEISLRGFGRSLAMYSIRLLQLSGSSLTELELPPAASISDSVWRFGTLKLFGVLPVVSIVVPFWGYIFTSLIYNWLNQKTELQWRLQV